MPNYFQNEKSKRVLSYFILGAVIFVLGILLFIFLNSRAETGESAQVNAASQSSEPLYSQQLDNSLTIAIPNTEDEQSLTYQIEEVEVTESITVQGKLAEAVAGRKFVIFNLKIVNPSNRSIQLQARDFIRISTDGGEEWIAPEIHNDPVEVQAISTKYTRVGTPVDDEVNQITVQLGEIEKEKQVFELSLQ